MASIRDLTCIRSVSHMAEYGKYEEEFVVYGCACKENGKLVYRISPQYHEIAKYTHQAEMSYVALSPIVSMLHRGIVQTGQREQILYETELQLARNIQEQYTHAFFDAVKSCLETAPNDEAKTMLNTLREKMNGIFSKEYIQLYEGLVNIAYKAKNLSEESFCEIQKWIRKMKLQMECDIVAKRPFVRTFYGIGYINGQGQYQYKVNADELIILQEQRKLKRDNIPVTPIFQKTYWYDYGIEPKTIRENFKKELELYYNDQYWSYWNMLKACTPAISKKLYETKLADLQLNGMKEEQETFLEYGYDWSMR